MKEHAIAVDVAKKRDFFAQMVMRDNPQIIEGNRTLRSPSRIVHRYEIIYIAQERNLPYPEMRDRTLALNGHRSLVNNSDLLVDVTGVGQAVVDLLREKQCTPIPILFTGGTKVHEVTNEIGRVFSDAPGKLAPIRTLEEIHVPKQDLVDAGKLLLQQGRVAIAANVKHRDKFEEQLMAFRGKVNEKTKAVKFEAEREEDHDDLVVCYLMLAWWMTRERKDDVEERSLERTVASYDPFDYM